MKNEKLVLNENGWTAVQDADVEKHIVEISCRSEDGNVVEVRIRHNDGEESKAKVLLNGNPALPMKNADFVDFFTMGKLQIN